jgi:hypothetical protein
MLEAAARRRGVTPEALKGLIAGITLMSYGPGVTDEQFEECLDLLLLDPDEGILNEALDAALNPEEGNDA